MRIPLFVLLFLLQLLLWSQQKEPLLRDSLQTVQEFRELVKDTLNAEKELPLDDSVKQNLSEENIEPQKKEPKKKRFIPFILSLIHI